MNFNSDITSLHRLNGVYNDCLGELQAHRGRHWPELHDPISNEVFSLRSLEEQTIDVLTRMDGYAALYPMPGMSRYTQHLAALVFHPGMQTEMPIKALLEYLVSEQGQASYLNVLSGRHRPGLSWRDVTRFQHALNTMDQSHPLQGSGWADGHVHWDEREALSRLTEFDSALRKAKDEFLLGGSRTREAGWAVLDAGINALANAIGYFVGYVVAVNIQESYGRDQKDLGYWRMFSCEVVNRLVQHTLRLVFRDGLWPACQRSLGIHSVSLENASKRRQWGQLGITGGAKVGCDMLGTFLYQLLPEASGHSALVQGAANTLVYASTDFVAFLVRGLTARSVRGAKLEVNENVREGVCAAAAIRGIQVALDSFFLTLYKQHCSNPYGFVALFDACELSPYIAWETWRLCRSAAPEERVSIELRQGSRTQGIPQVQQPSQPEASRISARSRLTTGSEFLSRINIP